MSGYRPPSSEPQGKWAHAIHRKRRSDGISQTGAFELLGAKLGLGPKSRAAYVAIDMGEREPTEAESKVLVEWLGYYPEDNDAGTDGSDTTVSVPAAYLARIDSLVAELQADRALIRELLGMLRPLSQEDVARAAARAELAAREAPTPMSDPSPDRPDSGEGPTPSRPSLVPSPAGRS
jgi:hypothetical protein